MINFRWDPEQERNEADMRTTGEKKDKKKGVSDPKLQLKDMAKKTESKIKSADPKQQKRKGEKSAKRINGPTVRIRDAVRKAESKIKTADPDKQIRKNTKLLKKREKEEIVGGALEKYYNSQELKPYQAELIKMQRHLENTRKKMVILFDGRDASGKGGTIRRIVRYMNEKRYRVVALGKPSEH